MANSKNKLTVEEQVVILEQKINEQIFELNRLCLVEEWAYNEAIRLSAEINKNLLKHKQLTKNGI